MSHHFSWKDGLLHAEAVPLSRIAESWGTPFYCYSRKALQENYQDFAAALADLQPLICFAVKANGNLSVLRTFAAMGAGADIVSGGELRRALAAGVPPEKIIFSGVGKTLAEIAEAGAAGIHQFNAESVPELAALNAAGKNLNRRLPVALRVNPDVDPRTHAKIATGQKETKFGINIEQLPESLAALREMEYLDFRGIAVHIGSQLTSLEPFDQAFAVTAALIHDLRQQGHAISRVDLGGGLGIRYESEAPPDASAYAALIRKHFGGTGLHIGLEPGRRLAASAGILVSRVIYAKTGEHKNFLIIDAAMNDLMRPALYDSWHDIVPVQEVPEDAARPFWDVVGPVCETSDWLGQNRLLPALAPGDLVAIRSAGAYGASMSSTYNARRLVPEFLVDGDSFALIRRPIPIDEQISWDVPPVWTR